MLTLDDSVGLKAPLAAFCMSKHVEVLSHIKQSVLQKVVHQLPEKFSATKHTRSPGGTTRTGKTCLPIGEGLQSFAIHGADDPQGRR